MQSVARKLRQRRASNQLSLRRVAAARRLPPPPPCTSVGRSLQSRLLLNLHVALFYHAASARLADETRDGEYVCRDEELGTECGREDVDEIQITY